MPFNSTIKPKHCKCSPECTLWPSIGYAGFNSSHAPQAMIDEKKKKKTNSDKVKRSLSQLKNLKQNKEGVEREKEKRSELSEWFLERRKEMQGVCAECGKTTNRHSDKYFSWSVCHVVPKSLIKSVATHEHNWIELCQLHHQTFDSTFDKAASMMCFGEVYQKFQLFKNLIPPEELRKVNPHLLKE